MNYKDLKVGDKFWMSAYSGIPSADNDKNNNKPDRYDIQELTFDHMNVDTHIGSYNGSIICKWGKADYVIISPSGFKEFASTDKWFTKSKCFLAYINDVNRIYSNKPLRFKKEALKEFNKCKEKYPELFIL